MLRILIVYYEPAPAGQTTHVLSLAHGLDRRRFHVSVVLPAHLERASAAFRRAGVEVHPLPMRKVAWDPGTAARLVQLVRREAFDVVHVHSQEAGLPARALAWLAGARRIVYTPQCIDIRRARWHWLYMLLERVLARITDVIVSVNECDRERLVRRGIPPGKVVTIPNGIDLAAFDAVHTQALRRTLGVEGERPLVLQVGRLSAQKDPLAFVEGARRVIELCPNAQFALVGEGPLLDAVTTRVQQWGLERRVHLLGWQPAAFRLMPAADVVTLTSRWEGTPYALLEAMACSRPVVATAVNGCPEVVADGATGFVVPLGDTTAWAGRVAGLLNDPETAAAMGRRGRERVEQRFSLGAMVASIERLYLATCSPNR